MGLKIHLDDDLDSHLINDFYLFSMFCLTDSLLLIYTTVDSRYLKSKEPSETLRDIRTSIYQMCRIEENTNQTTKFHK